jgi:hypothetical protein
MNYKKVSKNSVPCWYELSFDQATPAIILRIHNDWIADNPMKEYKRLIETVQSKFKFPDFSASFDSDFGFGAALRFLGKMDGFTQFSMPFPKVFSMSNERCEECEGTGWWDSLSIKCCECGGFGKRKITDLDTVYALSATLSVLTRCFEYTESQTGCERTQLMTIQTICEHRSNGGSLSGEFSQHVAEYLTSVYQSKSVGGVLEAMKTSWTHMTDSVESSRFMAYVNSDNGGLNTSCPGDACGLHPSGYRGSEIKGYEFSCHNVDSPTQQLTLIAGLAALHDLVRNR